MAVAFFALCGRTSAHVANGWYLVGSGLTPGVATGIYVANDTASNPNDGTTSFGTLTPDASGLVVAGSSDLVATTYNRLILHQPTGAAKTNRVNGEVSFTILAGSVADPPYATPVVLSGTPGDGIAVLSWTNSVMCDPITYPGYNVYRGTAAAIGTKIAGPLLTPGFTDTGRVNGTTYWYRVESLAMLSPTLSVSTIGAANQTNVSNVLALTPVARQEYVGGLLAR